MSFCYNITFVVHPSQEEKLLHFLRDHLIPQVFNDESPARDPQIRKVVEVEGEKPDPQHGLSMALAALFSTEEHAHLWHDHFLMPALSDFHSSFGNEAVFFITLLQNLY